MPTIKSSTIIMDLIMLYFTVNNYIYNSFSACTAIMCVHGDFDYGACRCVCPSHWTGHLCGMLTLKIKKV